jgi:hypothetical protein
MDERQIEESRRVGNEQENDDNAEQGARRVLLQGRRHDAGRRGVRSAGRIKPCR